MCHLPAVILASISTLESAGIQDSGSSTRSRIGILDAVNLDREGEEGVAYPWLTMASCFMLSSVNLLVV